MVVGDDTRVWWPGCRAYWPNSPSEDTVEELRRVLRQFGYAECEDGSFEKGTRKVAIFADDHGVPTHVAFQPEFTSSPRRRWKSKMGKNINMEHELLAVESKLYGNPVQYMSRKIRPRGK